MRSAAPFRVRPVWILACALTCLAPRVGTAQEAAAHGDRDAHAPDTTHPPASLPESNWRPGATLPPRTPERNLFAAPPPVTHDSVLDGAFYGAIAGAGAMAAPSLLGRTRTPIVFGIVAGAAIGSVIDARHVSPGRRPAVVVLADGEVKAMQFQWRF